MIDKTQLIDILSPWVEDAPGLSDRILHNVVYLGKTVYVVTQYCRHDNYEVVPCRVTTTRLSGKKQEKMFTVEGTYHCGRWYNATFRLSSIGRSVFLTEQAAKKRCDSKNKEVH